MLYHIIIHFFAYNSTNTSLVGGAVLVYNKRESKYDKLFDLLVEVSWEELVRVRYLNNWIYL